MFDEALFRQVIHETVHEAVREAIREEIASLQPLAPTGADALLTIEEVCERLSISKTTLWQLRRQGDIEGHNVGRRVLFRSSDVNALVGGSP